MPHEFKLTRRVEFADTDLAGIMHFSNFFRMMEVTEHAFFRSLGFSIHSHALGTTTGWPRVNASCDYRAPLRFEEEVEVQLLIAEIRTRSIRYAYVFRRLPDLLEVARGSMSAVCATVDSVTGKLVAQPIPDAIRAMVAVAPAEMLSSSSSPQPPAVAEYLPATE